MSMFMDRKTWYFQGDLCIRQKPIKTPASTSLINKVTLNSAQKGEGVRIAGNIVKRKSFRGLTLPAFQTGHRAAVAEHVRHGRGSDVHPWGD